MGAASSASLVAVVALIQRLCQLVQSICRARALRRQWWLLRVASYVRERVLFGLRLPLSFVKYGTARAFVLYVISVQPVRLRSVGAERLLL